MSHVIFTCSFCNRSFFKVETVNEHLSSSAACKENGATYKEEVKKLWNATISTTLAHSMAESNTQDKFVCIECGASFYNRGHMKTHMRQGHPTQPMVYRREDLKTGKSMVFDETPQGLKAFRRFFDGDGGSGGGGSSGCKSGSGGGGLAVAGDAVGGENRKKAEEKTKSEASAKPREVEKREISSAAAPIQRAIDSSPSKVDSKTKTQTTPAKGAPANPATKPVVGLSPARLAALPIVSPDGLPVTSLGRAFKIVSAKSAGSTIITTTTTTGTATTADGNENAGNGSKCGGVVVALPHDSTHSVPSDRKKGGIFPRNATIKIKDGAAAAPAPTAGLRLTAADLKSILARQKNGERVTIQSLKAMKSGVVREDKASAVDETKEAKAEEEGNAIAGERRKEGEDEKKEGTRMILTGGDGGTKEEEERETTMAGEEKRKKGIGDKTTVPTTNSREGATEATSRGATVVPDDAEIIEGEKAPVVGEETNDESSLNKNTIPPRTNLVGPIEETLSLRRNAVAADEEIVVPLNERQPNCATEKDKSVSTNPASSSSSPPKKQKVSRFILKDGKLMTEDGVPAPVGTISAKLAKDLKKMMAANNNKKKEALKGETSGVGQNEAGGVPTLKNVSVAKNPAESEARGDSPSNTTALVDGSAAPTSAVASITTPPVVEFQTTATPSFTVNDVTSATIPAPSMQTPPQTTIETATSPPKVVSSSTTVVPPSTSTPVIPSLLAPNLIGRDDQSKSVAPPKSRVFKVPAGCSADDIKKMLAAQLGAGVKIRVKSKVGPTVVDKLCDSGGLATAKEKSPDGDDNSREAPSAPIASLPEDDSIEITKVVKNSVFKSPQRPPVKGSKKRQIQLPVDRILMMPKNHRYLHPKFQPVVKLRPYSARTIQRLLTGGTLVVKSRGESAESCSAPTLPGATPTWVPTKTSDATWISNPSSTEVFADTRSSESLPAKPARKCCPVCMAAYAEAETLRSHINTEHNVEPFGYVEMDANGAPTNFVPFDTPAASRPAAAAAPEEDAAGRKLIIDAESKRKTAPLDSSSDESEDDPKLTIDSMRKRKKRLTKKRSHAARVKRVRHPSSSSSSLSVPSSSSDSLDESDDRESHPTSPSKSQETYPAGSTFTCTVCNETFEDVSTFRVHSRRAHAIRTDRRGGVSCLVSDPVAGTTELVRLKAAATSISPSKAPAPAPTHTYTCTICYEVFKDIDFVRMHARNQHKATKISYLKNDLKTGVTEVVTETGNVAHGTCKFDYFCPFCKAKFFAVSGLRQHCEHLHNATDFRYEYRDPATGKSFHSESFAFSKVDEALKKSGYKTDLATILKNSKRRPEELSD